MLLVQTTGSFQFVDPNNGKLIRHEGATVVENSSFIGERINSRQLTLLAELNDQATDAEWLKYLKDSEDDELAKAAFLENFRVGAPDAPDAPEATAEKTKAKK